MYVNCPYYNFYFTTIYFFKTIYFFYFSKFLYRRQKNVRFPWWSVIDYIARLFYKKTSLYFECMTLWSATENQHLVIILYYLTATQHYTELLARLALIYRFFLICFYFRMFVPINKISKLKILRVILRNLASKLWSVTD